MPEDKDQEQLQKLVGIIQQALERDQALRNTYEVGEKFRFIKERLNELLENIQKETTLPQKKIKPAQEVQVQEDEMLVYIHLYNAQGAIIRTWQTIVTPKAFFDFSVNRPIYADQKHIESFIRAKANKVQHAYLTVAMKKDRLLTVQDQALKDSLGNPLVKIKEGSLRIERTLNFTHNELLYTINEEGALARK